MRIHALKTAGILTVLASASTSTAFAQTEKTVKIVFDDTSKRVDLVTGKTLPNYTEAERGSVRFYYGRLDKPEEGFGYFFDGRSFQSTKKLALIRKMKRPGAWAIVGGGGWQGSAEAKVNTNPLSVCEIEHFAVSFVPIDPTTKKPAPKVYVYLDDLYMIEWMKVDHWVATMNQKDFDAAFGTMY